MHDDASPSAEAAMPETLTISFRQPIVFATITYYSMTLREPTAAEWEQWDKLSGVAAQVKAISVVAAIPEGAVKQLGVRDLLIAGDYLDRFF